MPDPHATRARAAKNLGYAVCPTCAMKVMTKAEADDHAKRHPAIREARHA